MKAPLSLLLLATMAGAGSVRADDAKPESQWQGSGGAALSVSSGNTQSTTLNLTADAVRVTQESKLSFHGQILGSRARSNNITSTSANQWRAGTRYDRNTSAHTFSFGGLDFNRDQIKRLSLRSVISTGLGYHLVKTPETQWDIVGGVTYRADQYSGSGVLINKQMKTTLDVAELLLGEDSSHKLTQAVSVKQRLEINPSLSSGKDIRAMFDTGLLMSLSKTLRLSVTLQYRYDSQAQAPIKRNDTMFFTGVNVKFGN